MPLAYASLDLHHGSTPHVAFRGKYLSAWKAFTFRCLSLAPHSSDPLIRSLMASATINPSTPKAPQWGGG